MLFYFYLILIVSGDLVVVKSLATPITKYKRWIDVDEQESFTWNEDRQKTPISPVTASENNEPYDLRHFSNFVKSLDNSVSDSYQSVNDISNLQSVETGEGRQLPGVDGTTNAVYDPATTFESQSQLAQTFPGVSNPTQKEVKPFSILNQGAPCGKNCKGNERAISDISSLPNSLESVYGDSLVSTPEAAFHSTGDGQEILVPQANIFSPGPSEHRVESSIHRIEQGPILQKVISGKTVYLRPFHMYHRRPHLHRINIMNQHYRNSPRLYLIHRTRHPKFIHVCEATDCRNGGTCAIVNDKVKCLCRKGYEGDHCEEVSKCYPDPCLNGGKCYEDDSGYSCTCSSSFYGEHCEARSYCHPNPCRNGFCYEKTQGYECSCDTGFKGFNCESPSFCHPNPCLNGGICSEDDVSYKCSCAKGFYGNNCDYKRQICQSTTCQNGGVCVQDLDTVHCVCADGFKGKTCEDKAVRPCSPNVCLFGGTCLATGQFDYKCMCPPGRTGRRCANIIEEPCASCHAHALCVGQVCKCRPGYTGSGYFCERAPSKCHPNPCENGGTCTDKYYYMDIINYFEPVYDLPHSVIPIASHESEEAAIISQSEEGDVVNLPNSLHANDFKKEKEMSNIAENSVIELSKLFNSREFIQHNRTFNQPFNDIKRNKIARILKRRQQRSSKWKREDYATLPEGVDRNLLNIQGFYCSCMLGYKGMKCEKTEPCSPNPCLHDGVCQEKDGIPSCICKFPYVGVMCNGTNACEPNPCRNGGKCTDNNGIATCKCEPRFDGDKCEISKCDKCNPNADCTLQGKCFCKQGYSGDGVHHCEKVQHGNTDPCLMQPCKNGGTCVTSDSGEFVCFCTTKYHGKLCEQKLFSASITKTTQLRKMMLIPTNNRMSSVCHPNPCLNDGQCMKVGDGYDCSCLSQYKGKHCEVDKCMECDIQADCNQGRCVCKNGYHGDGFSCVKDKQCEDDCPSHSWCKGDRCVCYQGYTWTDGKCLHTTEDGVPHSLLANKQNSSKYKKGSSVTKPRFNPSAHVHQMAFHIPAPPSPPAQILYSNAVIPSPTTSPVFTSSLDSSQVVLLRQPVADTQPLYLRQIYSGQQQQPAPQAMYQMAAEKAPVQQPLSPLLQIYQQKMPFQMRYSEQNIRQFSSPHYPFLPFSSAQRPLLSSSLEPFDSQKKEKELQALGVPDAVARQLVASVNKQRNSSWKEDIIISVYQNVGCWKDTPSWWDASLHAIPNVEGKYPRLTEPYVFRKDAVGQCADTAKELGYKVFAIQNGGQCFTSHDAHLNYAKYGRSNDCYGGLGGKSSSDVYSLEYP